MLKIEYGWNLKILENYGLKKCGICYSKKSNISNDYLCVDIMNGVIYIDTDDNDSGDCLDLLDTLFDLIKAGLVEKVSYEYGKID